MLYSRDSWPQDEYRKSIIIAVFSRGLTQLKMRFNKHPEKLKWEIVGLLLASFSFLTPIIELACTISVPFRYFKRDAYLFPRHAELIES
jgi:hypothetical protein